MLNMVLTSENLLPIEDLKSRMDFLGYDDSLDPKSVRYRDQEYSKLLSGLNLTTAGLSELSEMDLEELKESIAQLTATRFILINNPEQYSTLRSQIEESVAHLSTLGTIY